MKGVSHTGVISRQPVQPRKYKRRDWNCHQGNTKLSRVTHSTRKRKITSELFLDINDHPWAFFTASVKGKYKRNPCRRGFVVTNWPELITGIEKVSNLCKAEKMGHTTVHTCSGRCIFSGTG